MVFCRIRLFLHRIVRTYSPFAQDYITRLLNHLNYVGVLTLELFVTDKGLYANEMAPRVHNSGHWSIEGAVCSQFENHIRAVAGLPLGSTEVVRPCGHDQYYWLVSTV